MEVVKRVATGIRTVAQEMGNALRRRVPWPTDCLLCLDPVAQGGVCDDCERLLALSGTRCPRCAVPLATGGWCGSCLRNPPAFDDVVTAFDYRFPIDSLVRRFKFSADLATGAYLGDALARAAASCRRPDLVVPSPMSPARLRERGFNPALVLARRAGRRLGIAVDAMAVAKVLHTAPQAGLGLEARRRNLREAFAVRRNVKGLRVAVVDDVMTTGATLAGLAAALAGAGATEVSGWVVARTPEPPRER
jgi:ComF family protein